MQCVHNLLADWYALNDPEIISAWDWTIKRQTYSLVFVVRILLHETCLGLELTLEFLPLSEVLSATLADSIIENLPCTGDSLLYQLNPQCP